MTLHLHDSLSGATRPFEPADPGHVTLYVCGPTVYDRIHVGHARAAVVFDVLYRVLRRAYPRVSYVRNFTDVDDKINAAAAAEGVPIAELAERYAAAYEADVAALGTLPPDFAPRATHHVPEMIAMIERLIASGHAYEAEGHVLFAVESDPAYGSLSRRVSRVRREDSASISPPAGAFFWTMRSPPCGSREKPRPASDTLKPPAAMVKTL